MEAAPGRLARLAAHLSPDAEPSTSGVQQAPTASSNPAGTAARAADAAGWHTQCFNFEPGRLLLDQVAIITGGGGGIGKAVRAGGLGGARGMRAARRRTLSEPATACRSPPLCLAPVALQAAILFAQQGAKVVVSDIDAAKSQARVGLQTVVCRRA